MHFRPAPPAKPSSARWAESSSQPVEWPWPGSTEKSLTGKRPSAHQTGCEFFENKTVACVLSTASGTTHGTVECLLDELVSDGFAAGRYVTGMTVDPPTPTEDASGWFTLEQGERAVPKHGFRKWKIDLVSDSA